MITPANEKRPYKDMPDDELHLRLLMFGSMKTGFVNRVALPMLNMVMEHGPKPIKNLTKEILKLTAIRIFFGGISIEDTTDTANRLLDKGIGVIIDYSAPEGEGRPTLETIEKIKQEYIRVVDVCTELKGKERQKPFPDAPEPNISLAVKVSTLAAMEDMERIAKSLETDFSGKSLDKADAEILARVQKDLSEILEKAKEKNVGVYIDAEQTYINKFIHKVSYDALSAGYSLNMTVQAYLKDTPQQVEDAIALAKMPGVEGRLGVKLVRGAYIGDGREKGKIWHSGPETAPVYDDKSKALTDDSYNSAFAKLYRSGQFGLITVATHNEQSLREAAAIMEQERQNYTKVDSATLMGMGDILPSGEMPRAKYLPYPGKGGSIMGSVAYFARRGIEFMKTKGQEGISRGEQEYNAVKDEFLERLPPGKNLTMAIILNSISTSFGVLKEAVRNLQQQR